MWLLLLALNCTSTADDAAGMDSGGGTVDDPGVDSACSEAWAIDQGIGQTWQWSIIDDCIDCSCSYSQTHRGLEDHDGGKLYRIDEEGKWGGEGLTVTGTRTLWLRCDDDGIHLVADERQESHDDWGGDPVDYAWSTTWEPALDLLPRTLAVGDTWTWSAVRTVSGSPAPGLEPGDESFEGTATVTALHETDTFVGPLPAWRIEGLPPAMHLGTPDAWWSGAGGGPVSDDWHWPAAAP